EGLDQVVGERPVRRRPRPCGRPPHDYDRRYRTRAASVRLSDSSLKKKLTVPCGCARYSTSGPKSSRVPFPTGAATIAAPSFTLSCPHAQPLRRGASLSYQAIRRIPIASAPSPRRKTGEWSKKKS